MNNRLNISTALSSAWRLCEPSFRIMFVLSGLLAAQFTSSASAQFNVSPLSETVLDPDGLVLATGGNFSNLINGSPYQQEVLLSHGGYQYAVWYRNGSDQDIFISRRDLTGNTWETIDTGRNMEIGNQDWNSHNVISMGISSDGRIHLSYDHHVDQLRYLTTDPGFATTSSSNWNQSGFKAERSSLNVGGSTIPRITYPRFTNIGDDMVFTYRDFGSGSGDHRIADYNSRTGQWSSTRFVTRGRSTGQIYDDAINSPSTNRNSYHNGFHVDSTGRLHTTWTWREGTQDGNHDINYAYSDDKGVTWRNTDDQLVGTNAAPITLTSDVEVVDLDRRQALLNQQGQIVDANGGVHALMHHRPVGPTYTNSPFSDGRNADYHHYHRDPVTGDWEVNVFPDGIAVGSRPRLAVDGHGNLLAVYTQRSDLVIAGALNDADGYDWEVLYREDSRNYSGTPQLDIRRLFDAGILSIYVQDVATSTSPTEPSGGALRLIEFDTGIAPPVEPIRGLVAGWDTWSNGANPAASVAKPGVSGSAVTTSEDSAWQTNDERGASADGTWGSFVGPPTADTTVGSNNDQNLELGNATSGGTITFTITNGGPNPIELAGFHFDAYAFRPKAARTYELSVSSGDITNGVIFTSNADAIPHVSGVSDNLAHEDINHSLLGLVDHTLEPGESVDFLLSFSGGAGDGSGGHDLWVDNVGVTEIQNGLLGDFDGDGDVDLADLDQYNGNIDALAENELAAIDLDGDGIVGQNDFAQHYETLVETSNGGKGTFAGDANLDGVVDVLNDAAALVANLGASTSSWSQGDFNGDGTVDVLGDAALLVANLGKSNTNE